MRNIKICFCGLQHCGANLALNEVYKHARSKKLDIVILEDFSDIRKLLQNNKIKYEKLRLLMYLYRDCIINSLLVNDKIFLNTFLFEEKYLNNAIEEYIAKTNDVVFYLETMICKYERKVFYYYPKELKRLYHNNNLLIKKYSIKQNAIIVKSTIDISEKVKFIISKFDMIFTECYNYLEPNLINNILKIQKCLLNEKNKIKKKLSRQDCVIFDKYYENFLKINME